MMPGLVTELEKTRDFMLQNKEGRTNQYMGFKDFEISKVQRLIDWVRSDTNFDVERAKKNFYLFFKEHDRRRGTDFCKTFPTLVDFWNECERLVNG
jgi:hypothetical protein